MGGLFADKYARPSIKCDHNLLPISLPAPRPLTFLKNPKAAQHKETELLCRLPN